MMAGTENIYADMLSSPLLKLVFPKTSSSYIENLTIQSSTRQHIKMWKMYLCLTPSLSSRSVQYFTSSCNNFGKLRNDKLLLLMKKLCFFRVIFLNILLSLYPSKSFYSSESIFLDGLLRTPPIYDKNSLFAALTYSCFR